MGSPGVVYDAKHYEAGRGKAIPIMRRCRMGRALAKPINRRRWVSRRAQPILRSELPLLRRRNRLEPEVEIILADLGAHVGLAHPVVGAGHAVAVARSRPGLIERARVVDRERHLQSPALVDQPE